MTGMMFAGGLHINGTYQFAARLYKYHPQENVNYSSVVVTGNSSGLNGSVEWDLPAALVDHTNTTSSYRGYEDPRIESVRGRLKLLASAPFQVKGNRCKNERLRHQVFIPLDDPARSCMIRVGTAGVHPCQVQKNWVPLVPRGSPDMFIVYSVEPFQVLRFNESRCEARLASGDKVQPPDTKLYRSGSRYVYGFDVPDGAVYWSIGHTGPNTWYRSVLIAVLVRAEGTDGYTFERIGLSRPFFLEGMPQDKFAYAHSIFDFNLKNDTADIGLHVWDVWNAVLRVQGVAPWLRGVYKEHLAKKHTPM